MAHAGPIRVGSLDRLGLRGKRPGVTTAVRPGRDDVAMTDTLRLEAGMLLQCSHCGEWHTVRPADGNVGESEHALAMLYWLCRGRRFYAGQRGAVPRMPIRRPRT